ncbi:exosortase 1 system-associated amidotransferase 1 [Nitrosococcus halophilus Nc 4]|uniref:asparagine synthase (glutamine-hydrolyzing) n=1 Tax=Nitrosococcus halophilus (strain Nc4) TaxID=472759 RepID=D5C037_NITHN|nr:XrtA/PEP-CTERM system amidotransferase [Nitrosococcus halophilus]ADE16284.1 exosortase 1 system-associated amidotransferase 1 [Nitrosococcus halophilus Nc 4]
MCGIAGIFDLYDRRPIDRDILSRMNDIQRHRGPDDGGVHIEPGIGLAHRRLSIIDLSAGHQPLSNEDGTVWVSYNGEIYNFKELMNELSRRGHVFRTRCDTEVIVHAWEEWGEKCVHHFRGMFAFAVWDRNRATLFLARDRLGIKPLYYALLPDGHLIFGSELKALFAHPHLPRQLDPLAVEDYFAFGYVPDPRTILRCAEKLAPGHTLTLCRGVSTPEPRQYWDVALEPRTLDSELAAAETLMEKLREAVDIRLVADVPLGAFLSGGVDSSAVVATMAQLSNDPVRTCSIGFSDPAFDEARYAEQVARRYGTDHYSVQVDQDDFGLVDRLADVYDEPYADSSAMPTYRVCELARQRVKVALSGDGGDELFAGYRRYRWHLHEQRVRGLLPSSLRQPLFGTLGRLYPKLDWAPRIFRAKTTFQALARDALEGYFHSVAVIPNELRHSLFSEVMHRELQGYEALEVLRSHARHGPEHPLLQVQYLDMKTYLPGDILTKVDRASMAHGLEVRVPLLDHPFVEWAGGLPPNFKYQAGEGKYLFKQGLRPYLSEEILYRSKMGFAVPLAAWFRGPLRERVRAVVTGQTLAETGLFETRTLRRLVDQHLSGVRDYSAPIWSLLMFDAFLRRAIEGEPSAGTSSLIDDALDGEARSVAKLS